VIQLFGHLYAPDDRGLCVVAVDGDSIVSSRPTETQPAGSIGGPDARILPGLIDIQLNGAFGDDFADPAADVPGICRRLPRFGVTAFVPTIVTSAPEVYAPALANLRHAPVPGESRILGVHIEGPFISHAYRGAHDPAQLRLPSIEEAGRWLEAGDVRWLTLAPELPGALALISSSSSTASASRSATPMRPGARPRRASKPARPLQPICSMRCGRSGIATRASWATCSPPA